jgi:hypothetical protein
MITIGRRRIVMRGSIVDTMTDFCGTCVMRIGEKRWNGDIDTTAHIVTRGPDCVGDRIALRSLGQIHHGLGKVQLRFG